MGTETPTKCAHPACGCASDSEKDRDKDKEGNYCSQSCQEAAALTEIACQCGHPACTAARL